MKTKNFFQTGMLIAIFAIIVQTTEAQIHTWRVNNNPSYVQGVGNGLCTHCDTSLTNVVSNLAQAGDTVYIEPSAIAYNTITLNKKLHLIGNGFHLGNTSNTTNDSLQANPITSSVKGIKIDQGSDGSIIEGLRFSNGGNYEVEIHSVNNIVFRRNHVDNIDINLKGSIMNNILITQCYVEGQDVFANSGIQNISNLTFSNNYFSGSFNLTYGQTNLTGFVVNNNIFDLGFVEVKNCHFYNNILATGTFNQTTTGNNVEYNSAVLANALPTGNNNLNSQSTSLMFMGGNNYERKWQLNCNNVNVCGTGLLGNDRGMYGGPTPYKLSGIPTVPSIYILQSPSSSVLQGQNINVKISSRTNN